MYGTTKPKKYKASTLILVRRQTVPQQYVSPTVTDSLSDRISTIRQQVTSRSNLENLINRLGLYTEEDPQKPQMLMQDKVEQMRRDIQVEVHRRAAFSISFISSSPEKAQEVANALTSSFIDEHLRVREEQSIGTTKFLEDELARINEILSKKEATLTAYKQQHLGSLPEDLDVNLRRMEQLGNKVASIDRSLDEARTQKIMLQQQIDTLKNLATGASGNQDVFLTSGNGISPEIQQLTQQLKNLRLHYTENHPDVIKVKKMIEKIEMAKEDSASTTEDEEVIQTPSSVAGESIFSAQQETFEFQLATLHKTIKDLQAERGKNEKQISLLAERIDAAPKRQLELISLQRDYNAIKSQYDSLLAKKLASQLAENMEKRQKGEQFLVLDRAKLPEKPFSPNVQKIMVMALMGGLFAGCALALGLEYLDQSFRDYEELGEFLQIPVLAVIPRLETTVEARKRKRLRIIAYCLSGCFLVATGVTIWLWMNGDLVEVVQKIRELV
jgi:polysaccharide chain length determinant protein (PEP-CTERM system associated)